MDKWSPLQLLKMQSGGNSNFTSFVESYDRSTGGYPEGARGEGVGMGNAELNGGDRKNGMREKYGCWAVSEYREKVSAHW